MIMSLKTDDNLNVAVSASPNYFGDGYDIDAMTLQGPDGEVWHLSTLIDFTNESCASDDLKDFLECTGLHDHITDRLAPDCCRSQCDCKYDSDRDDAL